MLSDEVLDKLSERLVNRIESLNTYMIKKLGEQIKNIGLLTPSQLREVLQSLKYGDDLDNIVNKLAEITNLNVKDIYDIFEETAKTSQAYAKQFYDYKNIKFIPYDKNSLLQEQVKALARITANEYVNMSNTLAFARVNENGQIYFTGLSETYQQVIDEAILSAAQGRDSFNSAMRKTMRELTSSGIRTVDYKSGYSKRLDSAVRMNILTGLNSLHNELQEQFGQEFGADGIEISHHKNPAPDHSSSEKTGWHDIDGRQFSLEEFEKINNSLNRHVGELNCNHQTARIVLGISRPLYSEEQLKADKEANEKGFEFQEKHYTNYEGTQLQRKIETEIRKCKDRQIGAKAIGDMEEVYNCQKKISELTQTYKELSDISGLPTKIERLQVEGYRKIKVDKSNYKDVTKEWLDEVTPNSHKVLDRNYFEHEGVKYGVDSKNVVLDYSNKEIDIAEWLENTFGGELYMIPRVNKPDNISTPDYVWNGENWDLKSITGSGKRVIEDAIKKKKRQSNNFIFDLTESKLTEEDLLRQAKKIYNSKSTEFVDKIIFKKDNKVICIYKRK